MSKSAVRDDRFKIYLQKKTPQKVTNLLIVYSMEYIQFQSLLDNCALKKLSCFLSKDVSMDVILNAFFKHFIFRNNVFLRNILIIQSIGWMIGGVC